MPAIATPFFGDFLPDFEKIIAKMPQIHPTFGTTKTLCPLVQVALSDHSDSSKNERKKSLFCLAARHWLLWGVPIVVLLLRELGIVEMHLWRRGMYLLWVRLLRLDVGRTSILARFFSVFNCLKTHSNKFKRD